MLTIISLFEFHRKCQLLIPFIHFLIICSAEPIIILLLFIIFVFQLIGSTYLRILLHLFTIFEFSVYCCLFDFMHFLPLMTDVFITFLTIFVSELISHVLTFTVFQFLLICPTEIAYPIIIFLIFAFQFLCCLFYCVFLEYVYQFFACCLYLIILIFSSLLNCYVFLYSKQDKG